MVSPKYVIGIDVGGTFTDYTIADLESGRRNTGKVLNSVGYIGAFCFAMREALGRAEASSMDLARVVHGTTLSTNAILEQSARQPMLVTTKGFEDVLEIGRHDAPRSGNIHRWIKPRRPVGRSEIVGVEERVHWDGTVGRELTDQEVERVLSEARSREVDSVAVSLLHSPARPAHERHLGERLQEAGLLVSLSHRVDPRAREYERTVSTLLNAYVQPVMDEYLGRLEVELKRMGVDAPLYLMGSDGGVLPVEVMRDMPIASVLSGPAAGASAALSLARRHRVSNALSLDVGGTSSDVACVFEGELDLTQEGEVGDYPLSIPMIDIHTVGAGGGSIARAGSETFRVGPQSAKSDPGPAAYGLGGTAATVTDALVALGVLPAGSSAGSLQLDGGKAWEVITSVAESLGQDSPSTANAVFELANVHMSNAVRHLSIERGRDPRDFTLIACGGGGAAHAVAVARHADLGGVLIPVMPGVFTTEGLINANVQRVFARFLSQPIVLGADSMDPAHQVLDELRSQAEAFLDSDPSISARLLQASMELRYADQGSGLPVSWDTSSLTSADLANAFHRAHEVRYGYSFEDRSVEAIAVSLTARGMLPTPTPAQLESATRREESSGSREIWVPGAGPTRVSIKSRTQLSGEVLGPLLIDEPDTTVFIPDGVKVTCLDDGTLRIMLKPEEDYQ